MYGIVYWTGYSCQNKRQNALFWGRKSKNFLWRGHSPLHSTTPPQTQPPSAPAAPRPVFANPPVIFSQFSHCFRWTKKTLNTIKL